MKKRFNLKKKVEFEIRIISKKKSFDKKIKYI